MARLKLLEHSAVYHLITRIVGGQFLLEKREKEVLRKQMWQVAEFCGVEILTYCLMSNHFHVMARVPAPQTLQRISDKELERRVRLLYGDDGSVKTLAALKSEDAATRASARRALLARMGDVSLFMKELKQRFSIWYNKSHKRFGTLWAERFKSVLVQDDPFALTAVAAYIELNPVRAGIVRDPAEYRFCGYGEAMAGMKRALRSISSMYGYKRSSAKALESYRVAVFGVGEDSDAEQPEKSLDREKVSKVMREGGKVSREEALRCRVRYFSDGVALGSKEFVQECFESNRGLFGSHRRDGPRPLRGADWGDLSCLRNLRSAVFG